MPNQPRNKTRSFRISDEIYEEAQKIAKERGDNLGDVVRKALVSYIRRNRKS